MFPHDNTGSDSEVPAPSPPLGQGLLPPDTEVRKGEAGTVGSVLTWKLFYSFLDSQATQVLFLGSGQQNGID